MIPICLIINLVTSYILTYGRNFNLPAKEKSMMIRAILVFYT